MSTYEVQVTRPFVEAETHEQAAARTVADIINGEVLPWRVTDRDTNEQQVVRL